VILLTLGLFAIYIVPAGLFGFEGEGLDMFGGLAIFFFYFGWFAIAWATNLWDQWRLAGALVSFGLSLAGGLGLVAWENPSSWPATRAGKFFLILMCLAAVGSAVLFFAAWLGGRGRGLPAPQISPPEKVSGETPQSPRRQLPG
jgi:hypothetical protein